MTVHSFEEARIAREQAASQTAAPLLKDGDGGGTSGGMTTASNIEGRITRLEGAAVAAFVFLLVTFGGGYVLLSNQMNENTARIEAKLDTVIGGLSEVKTDVAVLEERLKQ